MRTKRISLISLIIILILSLIGLLIGNMATWTKLSKVCYCIAFLTSVTILILFIIDLKQKKADCPFTLKRDCPYNKLSQCPYDTKYCHAFQTNKKTKIRRYIFVALLFVATILYVLSLTIFCNGNTLWTTIENISLSVISAGIVATLIDLPGKIKEYQSYFVDLLSSNEYLKHLDEEGLSNLRQRVTWLQHAQDYPNMPRELLQLDESICKMMRAPYFKRFSQIMMLTKKDNFIHKRCSVEYTVQNPGANGDTASVDIGLSNSVIFSQEALTIDEILKKEANNILRIHKFVAYIDGSTTAYDLKPHTRILIYKGKSDNSNYNGEIHIAPLKNYSNKLSPLSAKDLAKNKKCSPTTEIANSNAIDFFIQFQKELVIKFEYEIVVPSEDKCFSKRLRYPVQEFLLDYSLLDGFDNTTLSGDLIGTLIDSKDISLFQSEDKKRLIFNTKSWMLPKNGVFIVHSN